MVKLNIGRAFGLGPSLLLLACTATVATGCLKNKMAAAQAIRTGSGDDARSLNAVGVATESGSPGFCLYSVKGQLNPVAAAPASGEPAALSAPGTEIVTPQALLSGELLQALETIPGIDNIRTPAIDDLVTPVILALGASTAAAGRLLPGVASTGRAISTASGRPPATQPAGLLMPAESRSLSKGKLKVAAATDQLFETTKRSLEQAGYRFEGEGAQGAAETLGRFKRGELTFQRWLSEVEQTAAASTTPPDFRQQVQAIVNRSQTSLDVLAQKQNQIDDAITALTRARDSEAFAKAQRAVREVVDQPLFAAVPDVSDNAAAKAAANSTDNAATQAARASRRWLTLAPWEEACGKGATGTRLVMKASLCAIGATVAAGGTLWGIGTLATGAGSMKINTDQVKAALAAQADNSADVVVDGASYERLVTGLKNFSRQILSNPAQASRPPCN